MFYLIEFKWKPRKRKIDLMKKWKILYIDECSIWSDKINENTTSSLGDVFRGYFANNEFTVFLNKIILQHMQTSLSSRVAVGKRNGKTISSPPPCGKGNWEKSLPFPHEMCYFSCFS